MAGKDINLILSEDESDDQFIQVPIKKKDFGDFITGLLGQPETINGRKNGSFTVDHAGLVNLHHLLDQRIKLQAKSNLVDFSAVISYREGPDRTLTSAQAFIHFNETRTTTTKSILLTWTYLVIFPGKPSPEKQEISVKFIADPSAFVVGPEAPFNRVAEQTGGISLFKIEHTERTWGDDITALVMREIDNCFTAPSFYDKHHDAITFILGLICVAFGIFLPGYIEEIIQNKEAYALLANALPNGIAFTALGTEEKLNLILTLLQPTNQLHTVGTGYKVLSFFASLAISAALIFGFDPKKKSHILITKQDKNDQEKYIKNERFKLAKKLISVLSAIALGVAGNYAYYLLHLPS